VKADKEHEPTTSTRPNLGHYPLLEPARVHPALSAGLFRHRRRPIELIVVDNGSKDGTGTYLEGVADAAPVPITVPTNPGNRGFRAAVNHGQRLARGEYLLALNNDAVVTDGWLSHLSALAETTSE
jgi:glycosyltransferase involved in cell wall biosynthesis